jgi:small subunit ribosomal protein S3
MMSVVKRIIEDSIERMKVDELLANEYEQAGYGGITLTKTPLGTQINLFAMRPGRVIGKRGRAIKQASARLEYELGLPNPQITVVEVEVPELNPRIMAARIANALERGVHYRRAIFWSLNRTMEAGAIGCEILVKGPLRSNRGRYEKVIEGYVPKSGEPTLRYVKKATVHVKMKKGTFGVNVTIVPPDAKFPDKVSLDGLPVIEYPEEEYELPEGVEPEGAEAVESVEPAAFEAVPEQAPAEAQEPISEPEPPKEDEASQEESRPEPEEATPQAQEEAEPPMPEPEEAEPSVSEPEEVESLQTEPEAEAVEKAEEAEPPQEIEKGTDEPETTEAPLGPDKVEEEE